MAILHRTTLVPSKPEVLARWVPTQPWGAPEFDVVGAYRFDDPDGEVGIETHLLRTDEGLVIQVPLTYRGQPLDGADEHLVSTMEHGVLGRRWVYDGCADPVWARAVAAALIGGVPQSEHVFEVDGRREIREPSVILTREGPPFDVPAVAAVGESTDPARIEIDLGELRIAVYRHPADGSEPGRAALFGRWQGLTRPMLLARLAE